MIARDQLDSAVSAGILSSAQADTLVAHYTRGDVALADREEVRFARGFHDVFVSLGILILFAGLFLGFISLYGSAFAAFATASVVAWALAEWLAARLRLALPSILLAAAFTACFAVTVSTGVYSVLYETPQTDGGFTSLINPLRGIAMHADTGLALGLAAMFGAVAFYRRFQVPITLTGLVVGLIFAAGALIEFVAPGLVTAHIGLFVLAAGFGAFGLAMRFDARDLARTTLNTDKAFWLHLLAAPLIVHSSLSLVAGDASEADGAVVMALLVLALGLVALVVDRRALLVSGLAYLGIAIANLLGATAIASEVALAATLLILGVFVLALGSGWSTARGLLLAPFAGSDLFKVVPPIRTNAK